MFIFWYTYSCPALYGAGFSKRNNLDTRKNGCDYPKIKTVSFYYRVFGPKDVDGRANSVDSDQTAPEEQSDQGRSSLIRVYTVCSDQGLHCLPRPVYPKT